MKNRLAWWFALALCVAPYVVFAAPPRRTAATAAAVDTRTGTLSIAIADDFERQRAQAIYTLRTNDGRQFELAFAGKPPRGLRTGATVRVQGVVDGSRLVVKELAGAVQVLAAASSTAPALPAPQKRKVLILLTDITDSAAVHNKLEASCDGVEDRAEGMTFGGPAFNETVDGAYLESSFGFEGIGGKAYPGGPQDVVRVSIQDLLGPLAQSCRPEQWADAADAAAVAAGINLGQYQHRVYLLPKNGCPFTGLGEVGCGDTCRAWEHVKFAGCGIPQVIAHELGHNRDFMHASVDLDNDGEIPQGIGTDEYGDYSDFMGAPPVAELEQNNAPHKVQKGWIDPDDVVDATQGGTFTISALELANPVHPQVLRVGPAAGRALYVSFRAPIGYDATMYNSALYLNHTQLHHWNPVDYNNTELVANLAGADTYTDPEQAVVVKQLSFDGSTAVVQVVPATFPQLTLSDVSIAEGQSGTTEATFAFALSAPVSWPVTAFLASTDGSAQAGSDYAGIDAGVRLKIPAGATSGQFVVPVYGDTEGEGNETFRLELLDVWGAVPLVDHATATLVNDDGPLLSVYDSNVVEGDTGTRVMLFVAALSQASPTPVTFKVTSADGSATAGSDFVDLDATTVTIPVGEVQKVFEVTINGDTVKEPLETFFVNLSSPTGATILDGEGVGRIINDDDLPLLSINDVSINEGDSDQKYLSFTVSLSEASTSPVSFTAYSANGNATAGSDYVKLIQNGMTIPAGVTSKLVTVAVLGETVIEPLEYFYLNLGNVAGANLADGTGIGYIINNDGALLSINDIAVGEGNAGTKLMTFTVSLSQVAPGPVTYNFSTQAGGSASAGVDYVATTQNAQVIPQGQLAKTHTVVINGDTTVEPTEVLLAYVRQPVGASVWDGQGTGYLLNDDGPTLSVPDASVGEGNSGAKVMNVTVLLSQASATDVVFGIATSNVSATAGNDYTALDLSNQVMPAGQTSKVFQIPIAGDTTVEPNESFLVTLAPNPVGATLFDRQAIATIYNDDGPTLSVNDVAISEGNAGAKVATFTVSLSQAATAGVSYDIATSNLTASAGSDYVAKALAGQQIPAGQLSKAFAVTINGDTTVESSETFRVTLSNISGNATLFKYIGTGTITNDD